MILLLHVVNKRRPLVLKTRAWKLGRGAAILPHRATSFLALPGRRTLFIPKRVPSIQYINRNRGLGGPCSLFLLFPHLPCHLPSLRRPLAFDPQNRGIRSQDIGQRHQSNLLFRNIQIRWPRRGSVSRPRSHSTHRRLGLIHGLLVIQFLHVHVLNPLSHLVQTHFVWFHVALGQATQVQAPEGTVACPRQAVHLLLSEFCNGDALDPVAKRRMHTTAPCAHEHSKATHHVVGGQCVTVDAAPVGRIDEQSFHPFLDPPRLSRGGPLRAAPPYYRHTTPYKHDPCGDYTSKWCKRYITARPRALPTHRNPALGEMATLWT